MPVAKSYIWLKQASARSVSQIIWVCFPVLISKWTKRSLLKHIRIGRVILIITYYQAFFQGDYEHVIGSITLNSSSTSTTSPIASTTAITQSYVQILAEITKSYKIPPSWPKLFYNSI